MTDKQPEALRLADLLEDECSVDGYAMDEAAAELRRLHKKCEALTADTIEEMRRITKIYRLEAQRDELLDALKRVLPHAEDSMARPELDIDILDARAVIAKAEARGDKSG